MVNNEKFFSSFIIPPGETLQEVLDDRNMSQKDLAFRTGLTPKHINNIIKGNSSISPDTAVKFESVLDTPASFWINLESDFQENISRIKSLENIDKEKEVAQKFPYTLLEKKGWIEKTKDLTERVINLRKYFRVASLEVIAISQDVNFRKSEFFQAEDYSVISWLNESERRSERINTEPFNKKELILIVPEMRKLTTVPLKASLPKLVQYCSSVGIALVVTPSIDKTHLNGATKWLSKDKVMVAISPRGGYEDIFWFTFFHELGHVLQEKKNSYFIDVDVEQAEPTQLEKEADQYAIETLMSTKEYTKFTKIDFTNLAEIRKMAETLKIDMGIIIGRLMKDGYLNYGDKKYQQFRKKLPLTLNN